MTPVTKPTREDIAVIMYTSGSTGLPKGTAGTATAAVSLFCSVNTPLHPALRSSWAPLSHGTPHDSGAVCESWNLFQISLFRRGWFSAVAYSSDQSLRDNVIHEHVHGAVEKRPSLCLPSLPSCTIYACSPILEGSAIYSFVAAVYK